MNPLVIASTCVNVILAFIMILFYLSYKTFPGFGLWTVGVGFIGLGYLTMVLREVVPVSLSITIQNTSFSLAAIVYLSGMRQFVGLTDISRVWYVLPLLNALFSGLSVYWFDSAAWRTLVVSLTFSVPHLLTAFLAFTDHPKTKSVFSIVIGTEMVLMSSLLIVWAIWAFTVPHFQLLTITPVHSGFFISLMVIQIVTAISFIMLNAERFNRNLMVAEADLKQNVEQLKKNLSEVRTLRGLLPICANCKKIRDDHGDWVHMEVFVRDRTHADFSHSICPTCAEKLYPDFYKEK